MRVIGIDPGTLSIDVCGVDDGKLFLDATIATADALADPAAFVARLEAHAPLDVIAGPSGYGLPLTRAQELSDETIRRAIDIRDGVIQNPKILSFQRRSQEYPHGRL